MDNGKVTALTLFDLSATFDTVDHNILIKRLSIWYGISDTALGWFSSYLTDIYQRVNIAHCFSATLHPLRVVFPGVLFLDHYFSATLHPLRVVFPGVLFLDHYFSATLHPLRVVFPGVLFLDHYFLLFTLFH